MDAQTTSALLMIRPVQFRFNKETAVNNYYQKAISNLSENDIKIGAQQEFDNFVTILRTHGIEVVVIDDGAEPDTPDSIFPNNWVSFHSDGRIGLYPMFARNRRQERRNDVFDILTKEHGFYWTDKIDFTGYEDQSKYLEGTGSMVLDRVSKIAYAALSVRTDIDAFNEFCVRFDYKGVSFVANQNVGGKRLPIYHTNVMMCVADEFAVVCLDCIDNVREREQLIASLINSGKEIIPITEDQKGHFAGNMLQVKSKTNQQYLVMSSAAFHSLREDQIEAINKYCPIIHSSLDIIEALGGGSARCMMAEIFLPKRS